MIALPSILKQAIWVVRLVADEEKTLVVLCAAMLCRRRVCMMLLSGGGTMGRGHLLRMAMSPTGCGSPNARCLQLCLHASSLFQSSQR